MISFYLVWMLCYFVLLGWIARKWPAEKLNAVQAGDAKKVTLIIPFRNERARVIGLVRELEHVQYPFMEILLVDDHSEDGSFLLFKENLKSDPRVKVIQSPGEGKKSALEFGVSQAQGELILCTDADCQFPETWVRKMTEPFSDSQVQLVAGPVMTLGDRTFFKRFQQVEWASILLLTWFFFSQKRPLMCSGANLAYRKSAFLKVGGYDQNREHLSGDDEFLLKKISKHFGSQSCHYLPFPSCLVWTQPQKNFSALLNQRIRWAGKWKLHGELSHAFSAIVSFLLQLVWLASTFLLTLGWMGVFSFFLIWIVKVLVEKQSLGKVLKPFGVIPSLGDFVKTGIIHPFYVLAVGFGSIRGKFIWKGRAN